MKPTTSSFRSSQKRHVAQEDRAASSSTTTNNLPKCHSFPMTVGTSSSSSSGAGDYDNIPTHAPQIVIAHRGASAHLPEHSLPGYRLGLELGADYIEPDIVATKDKQLIAIHSLDLSKTTNVQQVFGKTKPMTSSPYMSNQTGYWAYDFTLKEIKQLKVKQRLAEVGRTTVFDDMFEIPTLTEILQLLKEWNDDIQPQMYNVDAILARTNATRPSSSATSSSTSETTTTLSMNKLYYPPPPRGVYLELKDFPWLMEDTDGAINLVDLFFDHVRDNTELWQEAVFQHMCDTKALREHEYKLPPLIIQSFQASVLQNFTQQWEALSTVKTPNSDTNNDDDDNYGSLLLTVEVPDPDDASASVRVPLPVPPTILLVPLDKCHEEEFWFEITDDDGYRDVIKGIGPDKMCFFTAEGEGGSTGSGGGDGESTLLQYQPSIMEKAKKADWVVHPWTERPESEFLVSASGNENRRNTQDSSNSTAATTTTASSSPFSDVMDELMFLKCKVGVHGVFSESVDTAVRAMNMPCPQEKTGSEGSSSASGNNGPTSSSATPASSPSSACPTTTSGSYTSANNNGAINTKNIPLGPVILFSFFAGIFFALIVWKFCCANSAPFPRRRWRLTGNNHTADTPDDNFASDTSNNTANDDNIGGIMMTKARRQQRDHSALATSEHEAHNHSNHDLIFTEDDHEML